MYKNLAAMAVALSSALHEFPGNFQWCAALLRTAP